jgi:predicted nucleic acid-binding protein
MAVGDAPHHLVAFDANFLVDLVRGVPGQNRQVQGWLREGSLLQVSAVAWSEFLCGPVDESDVLDAKLVLRQVEPFTEPDAALAAELFNNTGRRSRSHVDCMIAAHAILRGARLATSNLRDFKRFQRFGLELAT